MYMAFFYLHSFKKQVSISQEQVLYHVWQIWEEDTYI